MKILVAALALATLTASPALAQSAPFSDAVIVGGKYVGQDPDANVRLQLRRDAGSENY